MMARDRDAGKPTGAQSSLDENRSPAISKSQRKREAEAIRELGEQLIDLSPDQLAGIALEEPLRQAVIDARRLRRGGAKKRQVQYVAKLLRARDIADIQEALEKIAGQSRASARQFHKLEQWREGLINDDRDTLDELCAQHVDLDRQHLHQLVRRAQRERAAGGESVVHYRKLFRYLRELEGSADAEE